MSHRWYETARKKDLEHAALEREADKILAADRRRRRKPPPRRAPVVDSPMPRRLTLADLATLRKQGLVP
jgi:hypothetical protein